MQQFTRKSSFGLAFEISNNTIFRMSDDGFTASRIGYTTSWVQDSSTMVRRVWLQLYIFNRYIHILLCYRASRIECCKQNIKITRQIHIFLYLTSIFQCWTENQVKLVIFIFVFKYSIHIWMLRKFYFGLPYKSQKTNTIWNVWWCVSQHPELDVPH